MGSNALWVTSGAATVILALVIAFVFDAPTSTYLLTGLVLVVAVFTVITSRRARGRTPDQ